MEEKTSVCKNASIAESKKRKEVEDGHDRPAVTAQGKGE